MNFVLRFIEFILLILYNWDARRLTLSSSSHFNNIKGGGGGVVVWPLSYSSKAPPHLVRVRWRVRFWVQDPPGASVTYHKKGVGEERRGGGGCI